jgi:predicted membrane GTPase involved in stress response
MIAQILHGVLAHKDQVYHKKLANRLAEERGWDSFRYDLRGELHLSLLALGTMKAHTVHMQVREARVKGNGG